MINPYRAPIETPDSAEFVENPSAEFLLTGRQIRYAESKFMLYRCGGRLVIASLVLIGLSVLVAFDRSQLSVSPGTAAQYQFTLILRELGVMALATIVYLGLILSVRSAVRKQLVLHGIVDGAGLSIGIDNQLLRWTGTQGTFTKPLDQTRLINARKGMVIVVDRNLFLFLPKQASFAGGSYQNILKRLKTRSLRHDHPDDPGDNHVV